MGNPSHLFFEFSIDFVLGVLVRYLKLLHVFENLQTVTHHLLLIVSPVAASRVELFLELFRFQHALKLPNATESFERELRFEKKESNDVEERPALDDP